MNVLFFLLHLHHLLLVVLLFSLAVATRQWWWWWWWWWICANFEYLADEFLATLWCRIDLNQSILFENEFRAANNAMITHGTIYLRPIISTTVDDESTCSLLNDHFLFSSSLCSYLFSFSLIFFIYYFILSHYNPFIGGSLFCLTLFLSLLNFTFLPLIHLSRSLTLWFGAFVTNDLCTDKDKNLSTPTRNQIVILSKYITYTQLWYTFLPRNSTKLIVWPLVVVVVVVCYIFLYLQTYAHTRI